MYVENLSWYWYISTNPRQEDVVCCFGLHYQWCNIWHFLESTRMKRKRRWDGLSNNRPISKLHFFDLLSTSKNQTKNWTKSSYHFQKKKPTNKALLPIQFIFDFSTMAFSKLDFWWMVYHQNTKCTTQISISLRQNCHLSQISAASSFVALMI